MNLFQSVTNGALTAKSFFICVGVCLLCGLICAFFSSVRSRISKSFVISLTALPVIVYTVITIVNGNIGTGVAVMGVFSLIRFRSVASKAKDIVSVFTAMAAGLACAAGYVFVALLLCAVVAVLMLAYSFIPLKSDRELELKITVPESLNAKEAFDEVFARFTKSAKLLKMKTSDMGSLYKLTYAVELKDGDSMKEFMDELRIRNGNLEILLAQPYLKGDEL